MLDKLLSFVAPHYCRCCRQKGSIFCESCKYNITSEIQDRCMACGKPSTQNMCSSCHNTTSFDQLWVVADRSGAIKQLVDDYKFNRAIQAAKVLADMLHTVMPVIDDSFVVCPVPTLPRHVRQRGHDHAAGIAKQLAKCNDLPYRPVLRRVSGVVQKTASRQQRLRQIRGAFCAASSPPANVLLVDDILTTGATANEAARVLKAAGAQKVYVAIVCRQPLD